MENTYKFDVVQVFTSDIDNNELVRKIEFSLIGYREDHNTFIIEDVDIPNISESLIPYNKLNKDIFISWVLQFVPEDKINQMKAKIDSKLEEMVNHFAQFKNIDKANSIKSTLPPWVSLEIPEGVVVLTPKDITQAIPL